ncbi:MAG: ABC transporter ATP-binding protein/permease [Bacteroidales bacterium]|jgi:subfamily B ATP-binding cassette protein MsbA|nr:ABC transporter ATP-binding protein/permease [Bacteroidales bacterium]
MKTLFRLLSFAPPLVPITIRYFILIIFGVLFSVLNISLLIPILDILFTDTATAEPITALPAFSLSFEYFKDSFYFYFYKLQDSHGAMGALQFTCAVVLVSVVLANVFKYAAQRTIVSMQSFVIRNLRETLFNKLMQLNVGFFYKTKKRHLLSLASNDMNEIQNVVASSLQVILRDPLFIIAFAIALFKLSPQLTLFSLLVLPVAIAIISLLVRMLKRSAHQAQTLLSNLLGLVDEAASGIRVIKIFKAEKYINQKFNEQNNTHRRVFKRILNRSGLASPLSEVLGIAAVVFIVLYGGKLILSESSGALSGSQFVTFVIIYSQILAPTKSVAQAVTNFQRGLVSADRVFAVLDIETEIKEKDHAVVLPPFQDSIQFENVSFAYNVDWIVKDINLTIRKGQTVALVGQSGAGKTTLANLIPRFYDVTKGRILIDGIDIKDCTLNSVYAQMSMVAQEQMLFNDTAYNNIVFGMEHITEDDVIHAAKIANAHEFIVQMEEGYQTNIGDQGNRLSGGQKQRLAIARAVLKNPAILILDEATSALDTESERLVQDALTNLMKNRTSIVIAHRLSTIQHADQIIVLDKGEIVEQGTHAELTVLNGVYKKLCDMQYLG